MILPRDDTGSMDGTSRTSQSLLQRVKQQEPSAWERLTRLYSPLVYAWCRECGVPATDAGDVMQEVFQSVYRAVERFRRNRASDTFRGWLWMITRNKVRDYYRDADRHLRAAGGTAANLMIQQVPEEEPVSTSSVAGTMNDSVVLNGIEFVKAEFEQKTWQAFWRFAVDDVKAVNVAEELGMTPGAVRKAKLRVMRRLKEELEDLF